MQNDTGITEMLHTVHVQSKGKYLEKISKDAFKDYVKLVKADRHHANRCTGMLVLFPGMTLPWLSIPCSKKFAKSAYICERRAISKCPNFKICPKELTIDESRTCARYWFKIGSLCFLSYFKDYGMSTFQDAANRCQALRSQILTYTMSNMDVRQLPLRYKGHINENNTQGKTRLKYLLPGYCVRPETDIIRHCDIQNWHRFLNCRMAWELVTLRIMQLEYSDIPIWLNVNARKRYEKSNCMLMWFTPTVIKLSAKHIKYKFLKISTAPSFANLSPTCQSANYSHGALCKASVSKHTKRTCGHEHLECSNRECILGHYKCDGILDCTDGSDEQACHNIAVCETSLGTIPAHDYCIAACHPTSCRCKRIYYQCTSGGCISMSKICNINVDCLDGSDEAKCDTQFMIHNYNYFGKTIQSNCAMMLILSHATLIKNTRVT